MVNFWYSVFILLFFSIPFFRYIILVALFLYKLILFYLAVSLHSFLPFASGKYSFNWRKSGHGCNEDPSIATNDDSTFCWGKSERKNDVYFLSKESDILTFRCVDLKRLNSPLNHLGRDIYYLLLWLSHNTFLHLVIELLNVQWNLNSSSRRYVCSKQNFKMDLACFLVDDDDTKKYIMAGGRFFVITEKNLVRVAWR